jgi:hypothetical protein
VKIQRFPALKLIIKNVPGSCKCVLIGAILLLTAFNIITHLVQDQSAFFSIRYISNVLLLIMIISVIYFICGAHNCINFLLSEKSRKKSGLRNLPERIELKTFEDNMFELTVFSRRCFWPGCRPDKESFIANLSFSEGRCSNCSGKLRETQKTKFGNLHKYWISCANKECPDLKNAIPKVTYLEHIEQLQIQAVITIRNNLKKFWRLYRTSYKGLTGSNYNIHVPPLDFLKREI